MIPQHEQMHEIFLRDCIRIHRREEEHHREERQRLEAKLRTLLAGRGVKRLKGGCPPAFYFNCILIDGSRCQHYNDGVCEKPETEAEK